MPAAGKPTFELGEGDMEFGVGIHGEPGRERRPVVNARQAAQLLVDPILAELPGDGPVIAFVNGLGGTPLIELYVLYHEVARVLAAADVPIARNLVGNYLTVPHG